MTKPDIAPPFPVVLTFPDIDAETLRREALADMPARPPSWPGFLAAWLAPLATTPPRAAFA